MIKKLLLISVLGLFPAFGDDAFAPEPPQTEAVKKLYAKKVHLEKDALGRPLPTNDWWTTLLSSEPFPGKMYAYPFTVSADASGLNIWYPQGWNNSGTELVAGQPLKIEPVDRSPDSNPAEKLLFDFETNWATAKWKIEGDGFGDSPMTNAQHGSQNFVGSQFAASFHKHDGGTGVATSPEFLINKAYMHFKVAGGDDRSKLGVHLLIEDESVLQEVGQKNNDFKWKKWDLKQYQGKKARIQLVDQSKGGWGFISADQFILSDNEMLPKSGIISHTSTADWGDWHVKMRLNVSKMKYIDITFGRGMPSVWIEPKGLDLKLPGVIDSNGVLTHDGRKFGVYGPGGRFKAYQNHTEFRGPVLVISALDKTGQGSESFSKHAAAIPRKTNYDWEYNQKTGEIETTWQVETSNGQPMLQGWIPHHYRTTTNDLKPSGIEYQTRRGKMQVCSGNTFHINWSFSGITPAYPLPEDDQFSSASLSKLIETWGDELLAKPEAQRQAKDTYWGGKSMLKTTQAMIIAKQLQHPIADKLLTEAKRVATDWLTYTEGEKAFYYARYPQPWGGLIGFNSSYGSEQFTDNHFHYGYLAMTAALIGLHDKEWLEKHGDAAKEVVSQYAESSRTSSTYPRLRTFECWAGHSYAGGLSNKNDGNNQESSSEAIGSWAAMFFLGSVMNDPEMVATGAMGFAIETEAVHEYWNNAYGWKNSEASNWSPNYKPTICSVMRDRDMGAWTWFSGEPIHIYGIQWLPAWTHLHYFGAHREHSVFQLDQMLIQQGKGKGKLDWKDLNDDWGQVTTAYAAFSQPDEVCKALDQAIAQKWPIGTHRHAGIPYYLAHANRAYGLVDSEAYTDLPTSLVVKQPDGTRTAILYNVTSEDKTVNVFVNGKRAASLVVPAGQLVKKKIN